MRHRVQRSRLSKTYSERKALLISLSRAMVISGKIITTKDRAKNARRWVERLITLGKDGSLSAKRRAYRILKDHDLISRLFNEIAPKFKSRVGGYSRIIRLGSRRGDGAEMVLFELTEKIKEEKPVVSKKEKGKSKVSETLEKEKPVVKEKDKHIQEVKEETPVKEEKAVPPQHYKKEEKKDKKAQDEDKKKSSKLMGGLRRFFKKEKDHF